MSLQWIKGNAPEFIVTVFTFWIVTLFMVDIGAAVFHKEPEPEKIVQSVSEESISKTTSTSKCTVIGDVEVCEK